MRHELHAAPGWLLLLEVVGDLMAPTFLSGDRISVGTTATPGRSLTGCTSSMKARGRWSSVCRSFGASDLASIEVISDNSNHKSYTLPIEAVTIIGRVCARYRDCRVMEGTMISQIVAAGIILFFCGPSGVFLDGTGRTLLRLKGHLRKPYGSHCGRYMEP